MKKILLTVLTVLLLSGCSASSAPKPEPQVQCAENFTFTYSITAGRTYKTIAIVPNITKKDAVDRSSRFLMKQGWQITSKDTESGFISAQGDSYVDGRRISLSVVVVVEQMNKDVEVSITYLTDGGVILRPDAIIKQFCPIVAAVEKKRVIISSYDSFRMARETLHMFTSLFLFLYVDF